MPIPPTLIKYSYSQIILALFLLLLTLILNSFNVGGLTTYIILIVIGIYLIYDTIKIGKVINLQNGFRNSQYKIEILKTKVENERRKKLKTSCVNNNKYKRSQILNVLQEYEKGSFLGKISKKGISENFFFQCLYCHFNKYIKQCYILYGDSNLLPKEFDYTPDFVFENDKIAIDIEVDEPYTMDLRSPIHISDDVKNERRDYSFTSRKWCVIRFSEEQVLIHPFECCRYIAKVIFELTEDNSFFKKLSYYGELNPIKFWDIAEANEMANNNFREHTFLRANHNASQLEYFSKNYFLDQGIYILTKIGETQLKLKETDLEQDFILCMNNTIINSQEIILAKKDFPEIADGDTFDLDPKEFKMINEFRILFLDRVNFDTYGTPSYDGYKEHKQPLIRLEKIHI